MNIKTQRYHLAKIKYTIQTYYGLKLRERNRKQKYVFARYIYFKIAREVLTLSSSHIGQSINRDHATVLHGVKEIENIFKYDAKVYDDYVYLKNRLKLKEERNDMQKKKDYLRLAMHYRKKYLECLK